jgi:protein ImuB
VLQRLDQALGLAAEPRVGLPEPVAHATRRLFAEPLVTAEAIDATITDLAQELCVSMAAAGLAARRFRLLLCRTDGTYAAAQIGTSRPCREPRHVQRLLTERLGDVDAGFGIDAAVLEATGVDALPAGQMALGHGDGTDSGGGVATLIDQLSSRLGERAVLRLEIQPSHVPERAGRRIPALSSTPASMSPGQVTSAIRHPLPPRPLFLLPAPEPMAAIAEMPDGPPLQFTWRRVGRRVAAAEGPERIAPEWWRLLGRSRHAEGGLATIPGQQWRTRDYYRIEDEQGGRYWVFRAGLFRDDGEDEQAPVWFMHGLFG